MEYALLISLILGTLYGFAIGIIPVAGAATGLIAILPFIDMFRDNPLTLVVFTTAVVVASTIGDSFSSIVMNIPGANGAGASMVDGFPMTRRGEGARALGAALSTSTVNGVIWGILVFFFLPLYATFILNFGIPEILAFLILAFSTACFISSKYWFRGIIALIIGIFVGLIGQDPVTGAERFTAGWTYLGTGVQLAPVLAGVLAFPELLEAYLNRHKQEYAKVAGGWSQIFQGFKDTWRHKWDGLRGGFIGAFVGLLPGVGGNVADWLAYGSTVASNKNEKIEFGDGNVKGLVGCEGANNAQKATSYVPTVLFGIPGAPFEVIIIALFMLVGLELGSPLLLQDMSFFSTLTSSYLWSLGLSFLLGLFFIRYAIKITTVRFEYYFWPIMLVLLWTSVQYTGYWEDYVMFALCCLAGWLLREFKFSRAAFVIGYVLSDRLEGTFMQYTQIFEPFDILTRPISGSILALASVAIIYGVFFNKTRIKYI